MDIFRPSLGFLSQSADVLDVLAVLLSGSVVNVWCRVMGTELLQVTEMKEGPEPGL